MKDQLMSIVQTLLYGVGSLLAAAISYYIALAVQKLKSETSKIQNEDQRNLVNGALDRLHDLVNKTVVSTEETVGKELKQAFADGQISKDEILALCPKVRDEVYAQLSTDAKDALAKEITDVQGYIEVVIENALQQMKNNNNPTSVVRLQEKQVTPAELSVLQDANEKLQAEVDGKAQSLVQLQSVVDSQNQTVQSLQAQIADKDVLNKQIEELQAQVNGQSELAQQLEKVKLERDEYKIDLDAIRKALGQIPVATETPAQQEV